MSAGLTEHQVDGLPWIVVRGERTTAFRALGERFAQPIAELVALMSDLALTTRRRDLHPQRFAAIAKLSQRDHPRAWSELESLAGGANVAFEELLLLNLRGDAGLDDLGCTDVIWAAAGKLLFGHNEDGDPALTGRCALLTLALDGEPVSTSWWYPGFLPGNTFSLNQNGLMSGLDNINIPRPAAAAGRSFVARTVQAGCRSIAEASTLLATTPSAGGFSYSFAEAGTGRRLMIETAAGKTKNLPPVPFAWHTNHLIAVEDVVDRASAESRCRAAALVSAHPPAVPDRSWLQAFLTSKPVPAGVHRDGSSGDSSATLCTVVVDVDESAVTLTPAGTGAFDMKIEDFVQGRATHARLLGPSPASAGEQGIRTTSKKEF